MVLLPLDALSVAAAVVQFVDFASKLISKGNEYHKSKDGALVENNELKAVTTNLLGLSKTLRSSSNILPAMQDLSAEEKSLIDVAKACEQIANEFIDLLEGLQVSAGQARWKSFRQAFKTIWKKDEIEAMLRRLSMAREALTVNLLVVMR